jgi:hypothetical protein
MIGRWLGGVGLPLQDEELREEIRDLHLPLSPFSGLMGVAGKH